MPTNPSVLSDSQIQHFKTFGFFLRRKLFSSEEIARIDQEYEVGLGRVRSRIKSAAGERRQFNWSNVNGRTPYLVSLMEDPRIGGAAEQLLGQESFGLGTNSNQFNGDRTEWHPDLDKPHILGSKFLLYTQPIDGNSGALRVIPGSHKHEFSSKLHDIGLRGSHTDTTSAFLKRSGLGIGDIPAYICNTEPGDVITFDYRLWHASWAGLEDRRMISFNFYTFPKTPEQKDAMQELADVFYTIRDEMFPEPPDYRWWVEHAQDRAKVQRWIHAIEECGLN